MPVRANVGAPTSRRRRSVRAVRARNTATRADMRRDDDRFDADSQIVATKVDSNDPFGFETNKAKSEPTAIRGGPAPPALANGPL